MDESNTAAEDTYIAYGYRWFILFMFALLVMTNAVMYCTFAPISNLSENFFGGAYGTPTTINLLSTVFLILYLPGSLVGIALMKKINLKHTMTFASFLNVLGSLLRYVAVLNRDSWGSEGTYMTVFLGQSLCALTYPIYVNLPAAVASIWFPVHQRDMTTTAGAMFNPIGNALGQVLPVIFVTQTSNDDVKDDDSNSTVHGMADLMLVQFLLCVVPFLMVLIFFKDAPPTPPSQSTKLKLDHANRNKHAVAPPPVIFGYANDPLVRDSESGKADDPAAAAVVTAAADEESPDAEDDLWTTVYTSPGEEQRQSVAERAAAERRVAAESQRLSARGMPPPLAGELAISSKTATAGGSGGGSSAREAIAAQAHPSRAGSGDSSSSVVAEVHLSSNAWHILKGEMRTLFSNRDYIYLLIAFTFDVGILNGLLPLFNQMLSPHGYSNADAGTIAAVIIVVGLVGAVVGGILMEKTHAYRAIMKGYVLACSVAGLLFYSMMIKNNFWPLLLSGGLLGFVALPLLPVMMEVCAETTYPIPEEVSTGLLHNGANFFAVGIVFAVQGLLTVDGPGPNPFTANAMFVIAIFSVSTFFTMLFQGHYVRTEHEKGHCAPAATDKKYNKSSIQEPLLG